MKNCKKIGIILLIVAIIVSFINITPRTYADTYENYIADKSVTALRPGDEVYFDNSGTKWEHVYIHIWQDNGTSYKEWNNADELEKIGDTNFYKYVVPDNYQFRKFDYKNIIFKNGQDGNSNQTINLGFIESGFAYLVTRSCEYDSLGSDNNARDKKLGYWHLYDKESIVEHLNSARQYQENKARYTDTSYANLDKLLVQAATENENQIVLYAYQDEYGNDINLYYITIATTLRAIDAIINNLQVYEGSITLQTDGNGSIVTDQADDSQVEIGTEVTITTTPNDNYEIDEITVTDEDGKPVQVTNNKFTMPRSNVTVNATFKKIQKSITTITENGSITTNQADDSKVDIGETVVLTITPNQWYELESLTVTDEDGNPVQVDNNTFVMPASNVTINGKFKETIRVNNIIINETENGSVVTDVGPEDVTEGTEVTITTTPNYGYELDTITVQDEEGNNIAVNNNTFIMPKTDAEITATFKHIKKSITLDCSEGGTVATNQSDNSSVNVGEKVTITLTPDENYELESIKVTDESGEEINVTNNEFTMPNSNVTVEVKYKHITKSITIKDSGDGITTTDAEDNKKVNVGETVKILATPADGSEVKEINVVDEDGNKIEISDENTFVMPNNNIIISTVYVNNNKDDNNSDTDNNNENKQNQNQNENKNEDESKKENENKGIENKESKTEKKDNNSKSTNNGVLNTPKTGDAIIIVAVILAIAIVAFIILSIISKRNKKMNKHGK